MEAMVIGWTVETVEREYQVMGMKLMKEVDVILAWCLNKESERVTFRIDGFRAELAIRIGEYASISENLMRVIRDRFPHRDWEVLPATISQRRPMFYYSEGEPYMVFRTPTIAMARAIAHWLRSGSALESFGIPGILFDVSGDEGQLHEQFMVRRDMWSQGWCKFENYAPVSEEEKRTRSSQGQEFYLSYEHVTKSKASYPVHPVIFAFDLEVQSGDGVSFPVAKLIGDYVGIASIVVWKYGLYESTKQEYLIVRGKVQSIPGVNVICVDTENELLDEYDKLLAETCPVVVTHYNGDSFDTYYLDRRYKRLERKWPVIGAHKIVPTEPKELFPSMNGRFRTGSVLIAPGVCNIDMMKVILENYKFRSNSLDSVCRELLKSGKVDIGDYTRIFKAFKQWDEEGRGDLLQLIVEYGMEDSRLVAKLFEHQKSFDNLIEMAQASEVSNDKYSTRGRMERTKAMFYKQCYKVSPRVQPRTGCRLKPQIVSGGGYVAIPVVGLHDYVVTFDFTSLYPSIIASFLICYVSLLTKRASEMSFEQLQKSFPSIKSPKDIRHIRCDQEDGVHRYKIVKHTKAVLPGVVIEMLARRVDAKLGLEEAIAEGDNAKAARFNLKQLAIKVANNSVYGFLNAPGEDPLPEGTQMVTALGRLLIHWTRNRVQELDPETEIVYGDTDSVMIKFLNCSSYEEAKRRSLDMLKILNSELAYIETNDNGDLYVIPPSEREGIPPKILKLVLEKIARAGFVTGKGYFMVYTDLFKEGVPLKRTEDGKLDLHITGLPCVKRDRAVGFCEVYADIGYHIMDLCSLKTVNDMVWESGIKYLFDLSRPDISSASYKKFCYSGRIGKAYEDDTNAAMAQLYHRLAREGTPLAIGVRFDYYVSVKPKGLKQGHRFVTGEELEANRKRREEGEDIVPIVVDRLLTYQKGFVSVLDTMISTLCSKEGEQIEQIQQDKTMEWALSRLYLERGKEVLQILSTDPNPCVAIGCAKDKTLAKSFKQHYSAPRNLAQLSKRPASAFLKFVEQRARVLEQIRATV